MQNNKSDYTRKLNLFYKFFVILIMNSPNISCGNLYFFNLNKYNKKFKHSRYSSSSNIRRVKSKFQSNKFKKINKNMYKSRKNISNSNLDFKFVYKKYIAKGIPIFFILFLITTISTISCTIKKPPTKPNNDNINNVYNINRNQKIHNDDNNNEYENNDLNIRYASGNTQSNQSENNIRIVSDNNQNDNDSHNAAGHIFGNNDSNIKDINDKKNKEKEFQNKIQNSLNPKLIEKFKKLVDNGDLSLKGYEMKYLEQLRNVITLICAQSLKFKTIEDDLQNDTKENHWLWYVFMSIMPGKNDPYKTNLGPKHSSSAILYLELVPESIFNKWIMFLEIITKKSQNSKYGMEAYFRSEDYGRPQFTVQLWSKQKYDQNYSLKVKKRLKIAHNILCNLALEMSQTKNDVFWKNSKSSKALQDLLTLTSPV